MTEMLALLACGAVMIFLAFVWGYHEGHKSGYSDGRDDGWRSAKGR